MERKIVASGDNRRFLMKLFNVTERTIFNALAKENSKNELHRKIRKAALERGAVEVITLPVLETIHDTEGKMRQYFPNGAILEIVKAEAKGKVIFKGKKVAEYQNVELSSIYKIQQEVASLR